MVSAPARRHAYAMTSAPLPGTPFPALPPAPPCVAAAPTGWPAVSAAAWPSTAAIDSLLWRVGFVALTLAGGAGIVVYLLLWVFMAVGSPPAR